MPLIDIHTHQKNKAQGVFRLHNQYPLSADVSHPFSAGIHPWYVDEDNWEKQWEALKKTILNENCKAIGECGMDRNISLDFQLQQYIFKQHIELSETIKKPLIIHCVKAYAEVVALRKQYRPKQQWILHGFRKNQQVADMLLGADIALSFGEALLHSESLQQTFKNIPEGSYFLETDTSDVDISLLYQKAIEVKKRVRITFENECFDSDKDFDKR